MAQIGTRFILVRDYIDWAMKEGCKIQNGYTRRPEGIQEFILVIAPSGRHAVIFAGDDEYIPERLVANCDRRLGLKSPPELVANAPIGPFKPEDSD